jgi:hypothetical protein
MESGDAVDSCSDSQLFQKLEEYPWDKDSEFQVRNHVSGTERYTDMHQGGLMAILGDSSSPLQIQQLTLRARCFYYSRKNSQPIDFDAYKSWRASQADLPSLDTHPRLKQASQPSQPPPHKLFPASSTYEIPPAEVTTPEATEAGPDGEPEAPYPQTFSQIVALITSGAPIPGIKEIPSTVLADKATIPQATKRRKPWEKDEVVAEAVQGTFGDKRDDVIVQEEV